MRIAYYHVDAFTDRPFAGNPAAVCLLEEVRAADWMQSVAAEMNLSETAFVRPLADGFELRWFTPAIEVELCGHATLAAAHALWTEGVVGAEQTIRFHTKSGVLTCTQNDGLIELDFPATPAQEVDPPAGLLEALGVRPSFVGKTKFVCFVVGQVEHAPHARRDKDLPHTTAAVDAGLGTGPEQIVQALLHLFDLHAQSLQNLWNHSLWLLQQRQQNVLGINLCVSIARHDLDSPLGCILRTLGKTI